MENKPPLRHEKAITDYLCHLGKLVEENVCFNTNSGQVIVLTVSKFNIMSLL
jgi:hypothetical protein